MRLMEYAPKTSQLAGRSFPNALDEFISRFFGNELFPTEIVGQDFYPSVDVMEKEKEIIVKADLPGINEKGLNVEINEGNLIISGHREEEKMEEKNGFKRIERQTGFFSREIALSANADEKGIMAEYKKGVLTVTVPKTKETPSKKLNIKVS